MLVFILLRHNVPSLACVCALPFAAVAVGFRGRAVKYDVETAQLKDNGVFWIDFASIFQYFRNVFMNWNPCLFSFRYVRCLTSVCVLCLYLRSSSACVRFWTRPARQP